MPLEHSAHLIHFFSVPLHLPNVFTNEFDLATNSQYLGKAESFNPVWQGRYKPLDCWYVLEHKLCKKCALPTVEPVLAIKLLCTE